MTGTKAGSSFGRDQQLWIALLRITVGWHFFYEGWAKLADPGWTAAGYLRSATGPAAVLFHALGTSPPLVTVIDVLNIGGLILIGLGLILGLLIRPAAFCGIGLLALYYLAHPPLFAPTPNGFTEGSYLIINKNLVELIALAAVAALPSWVFGLDGLIARRRKPVEAVLGPAVADEPAAGDLGRVARRQLMANLAGVPFLGAVMVCILKKHGWRSFEEVQLRARANERDTFVASATVKTFRFTTAGELKGRLPAGKIGNVTLSRMILGGNLIGGWAHARDLIYVSKLVRAYHHRDKIFETFALAEKCGVNTVLTNPLLCKTINDYWRQGGRIQFISDCGGKDVLQMIRKSIDHGACACYIQGGVADQLVEKGQFDLIAKSLDLIRANRLPAGIGGHKLRTIQSCVEKGLRPDFWMKTLHRANYWSAAPQQPEHDNIWCENAAETIAYMAQLAEPWIAFKILAAGAIEPKVAFRFAFESGADFICVGMYDFQIVDDVNLALDVLNGRLTRQRVWHG